jgi:hypothetical protein
VVTSRGTPHLLHGKANAAENEGERRVNAQAEVSLPDFFLHWFAYFWIYINIFFHKLQHGFPGSTRLL